MLNFRHSHSKLSAHKTSMLQDLERGRPMEIGPLVSVVQEMGRLTQIPTPAVDAVPALVAQRAEIAGLYGMDPPVMTKPSFLHDRVAVIGVLAGGHLPVPTASSRPQSGRNGRNPRR